MIGMPYLQLVCAQDRDTVAGLIDRAFDGEAVNCTFTAANGMLCQSSFVSIADEQGGITNLLVLTQDVTDHQVRAATLSELQKRNALILESAGEGIYGLDADGQITFGNDAAARIVGWRTENVIGQKIARRPSPLTRQWLKLPPR
jgi:PAS domain-containing protein